MSLQSLPIDCLHLILVHLSPLELSRVSRSCSTLFHLIQSNNFWKLKFQTSFHQPLPEPNLKLIYYSHQLKDLRVKLESDKKQLRIHIRELLRSAFIGKRDPSEWIETIIDNLIMYTKKYRKKQREKFLYLKYGFSPYYHLFKQPNLDSDVYKRYPLIVGQPGQPGYPRGSRDPQECFGEAVFSLVFNSKLVPLMDEITKLSNLIWKLIQ